jgi:cysteine-rich repeat protein
VQQGVEECDDGDDDESDDCIPVFCTAAECGDGYLWDGMEECDDGNVEDADACPSTCEPAVCGDGIVWEDMEECDDGNMVDDDDCANDCTANNPCGIGNAFAAGVCWAIAPGCNNNTVTCQGLGLAATAANTNIAWDMNLMQEVADQLGVGAGGVGGCCAQAAWYNPQADQIYTHNFGNSFYNWSNCISGHNPLHTCIAP